MGIPLDHPCIQTAVERGLISREQLGLSPLSPPPRPPRKLTAVVPAEPARWTITLTLPCSVVSEANRRDHWAFAHRRAKQQAEALRTALDAAGLTNHAPPLPLIVTWIRTGKKVLDDDNLARAFKSLRDRLAEWIGCDDGSDLIEWKYQQERGTPGVRLSIEGNASC
ncbi:MAG: hypothetical protein U0792_00610 [Gemmataceae bacterium]